MDDLLSARVLMALSLAFHIVFAVMGIGMPLLMALAEALAQKRRDPVYMEICRRWSRGTAVFFAIGAVSGTVLSFELGLLWPGFMRFAGSLVGLPFSLEGFAFFTEAVFLGIYLYGWRRVSPAAHLGAGIVVALSGALSGVFVTTANAWMNTPSGLAAEAAHPEAIDPIAAMLNPAALHEVLHMMLAAYAASSLAVAAVHAYLLLHGRNPGFHRRALGLALAVAGIAVPLLLLSGDYSGKAIARLEPIKLAAAEALYDTQAGAPLIVGGLPDDRAKVVRYGVKIPLGLSVLAFGDPKAVVRGLAEFPREDWPNVAIVHLAFDIMVASGAAMLLVVLWAGWLQVRRRRLFESRRLLRAIVLTGPLGFAAIEAGWLVTEMGRQPWAIKGIMRTSQAVTPVPHLEIPLVLFTALYVLLGLVLVFLLRAQFAATLEPADPGEDGHGQQS